MKKQENNLGGWVVKDQFVLEYDPFKRPEIRTDCTRCRWFSPEWVGSRGWTGACDAHACVVSSSSPGQSDCPEFRADATEVAPGAERSV